MTTAVAQNMTRPDSQTFIVAILVIWQLVLTTLLTLAGLSNPKLGALSGMLWGVNIFWIGLVGLSSIWFRDQLASFGKRHSKHLPLMGFLFAMVMALIEEAVTTTMTNCAPLFGAELGDVYITASANYFDVVLFHSVIVMLPQFALLAWLLGRFLISPFAAFMCYGFTGFFNEALFSGPNPLALAQWILIYGLMVYAPACLFRECPGRRKVGWWFFPVVVILPILASIPMVALLLLVIAPDHPSIHFPPM